MTTGVLLINTGTPDAPTVEAIRPYLTEFLMDPAIIGAPYFVRRPLVAHIVKSRPERTAEHYRAFWSAEGSPFMNTCRAQRDAVAQKLGEDYRVEPAMRYGNPSIRSALEQLRDGACTRVVLVPMYPQNVNVCAGTCFTEARRHLRALAKAGWAPDVVEVPSFHDQPAYRAALCAQVRRHWRYEPGAKLIVSFHSTMQRDIDKDDTYRVQTTQTKDWLAADLGVAPQDAFLSYQSRFDSRKWLSPFTEQVLLGMVGQGVRNVCVVCPGFVADNIETVIEVNRDLREKVVRAAAARAEEGVGVGVRADKAGEGAGEGVGVDAGVGECVGVEGGFSFTYVPALGTDEGLISAVVQAIRDAL